MIIMKFGATAMESAHNIKIIANLIHKSSAEKPVVVVSALPNVTYQLTALAQIALLSSNKQLFNKLNDLEQKYTQIINDLFSTTDHSLAEKQKCKIEINNRFEILKKYLIGINLIKELSFHSSNYIKSFGERLSAILLSYYLNSLEIKSDYLMSDQFLVTNNVSDKADPIMSLSRKKLKPLIEKLYKKKSILVITGCFGKSLNDTITRLGIDGSDYSASTIGSLISAKQIQIWTDLSGIYTADPDICPLAQPNQVISFREASELARFGSKIMHPSTISPAIEKKIPFYIKNIFQPDNPGTEINYNETQVPHTIKAVTSKNKITLITIETTKMLMTHGFLSQVFQIFENHNISIDIVATSEVSISISVDTDQIRKLIYDLKKLGTVTTQNSLAIISIIGIGLKGNLKLNTQILESLYKAKIEAQIIMQSATQSNFTIVVHEHQMNLATKTIHKKLFEQTK